MKTKVIMLLCGLFAGPALAADFSGTWSGDVELPNGQKLPFVAVLEQNGNQVTGILKGIGGAPDVQITNGRVDNELLRFSGVRMIQDAAVEFSYFGVRAGSDVLFTIYRVGAEGPGALLSSMTTLAD